MSASREGRWLVPAGYPGLAWLQSQASAWLEASGVEASAAHHVLLALDELAANIVEHAPSTDEPEPFEVRLSREGGVIELVVLDAGPPFDPREVAPAPSPAALEEVPAGGLGLVLVRRLAGSIHYERVDGKNQIRLAFTPSGQVPT